MGRKIRHMAEWLSDRFEDVLAFLHWDGAGWKPPEEDPRNRRM